MILFSGIKLFQGHNLSDDRILEIRLGCRFRLLSDRLLRFILVKNDRSILRSGIGTLTVQCRGIVGLPKEINDLLRS